MLHAVRFRHAPSVIPCSHRPVLCIAPGLLGLWLAGRFLLATRLWTSGDPIQVKVGPDGLPLAFLWHGEWRLVAGIANRWRVRASWWSEEAWREYIKLITADGLLCTLYRDLEDRYWACARLYD